MKKFNYKNYKDCYFIVGSYRANKEAISISIQNDDIGAIAICTMYIKDCLYSADMVTIKNYSENSHMTEFLMKLGIVIKVMKQFPCNPFVEDTLQTNNPQSIDVCFIDKNKLKEYSKVWNYDV